MWFLFQYNIKFHYPYSIHECICFILPEFSQGNMLLIDDTSYLTGRQDLGIIDMGPASHGLIHIQGSLSSSNRF
jgi:hypothetical protein